MSAPYDLSTTARSSVRKLLADPAEPEAEAFVCSGNLQIRIHGGSVADYQVLTDPDDAVLQEELDEHGDRGE